MLTKSSTKEKHELDEKVLKAVPSAPLYTGAYAMKLYSVICAEIMSTVF